MSSLFNLSLPLKINKPLPNHPWQNTIKENLAESIKYGHNSVQNPEYPKIKEKAFNKNRFKFTIIGNRVTKEFNYCVKLLKGLHKYRAKNIEPPVIRGVTGVEWPIIWNELKLKYGGISYCLRSQVAVLLNDKILGDEQDLKSLIDEKYQYHFVLDYYREGIKQFSDFVRSSGRPCAYMHISIDGEEAGTLIFMLYSDILPYTCENFLRLCQEKKGGYSGTPVHRIVKDGWIQCGGFGLKNIDFDCENFIIPHDRRGLLCMANDGRHIDCSTQFFVLLEPAQWMDNKYVAFGQLIDGEGTLCKIENIPTYYEAPKLSIIIYDAGVLNMECQDIMINRGAVEYIRGHIENLFTLGEDLIEDLMYRVFAKIERREAAQKKEEDENVGIRSTKRFMRKKEDFDEQIDKSNAPQRRSSVKSRTDPGADNESAENNEFDVDVYDYEPEEYAYSQIDLTPVVKPDMPYYIALTDVPYPGEIDSTYDVKKLLHGNYCLEADLEKNSTLRENQPSLIPSCILNPPSDFDIFSDESLDSDDEKEIRQYLKDNVDRVSFAGGVIRNIARGKGTVNIFEGCRKSELLTDNELRKIRMAMTDMKECEDKQRKVSINVPITAHDPRKIKRRQTGFLNDTDIQKIEAVRKSYEEGVSEDDPRRKVRIASDSDDPRNLNKDMKYDLEIPRPSVLTRLYDRLSFQDNAGPTLKNYKPLSELHNKNLMLTYSSNSRMRNTSNDKFTRPTVEKNRFYEQMLNIQHGKKCARKISSDYVKIIGNAEQNKKVSIRSVEFAKIRPSMTIAEYQLKNQRRASQGDKQSEQVETVNQLPGQDKSDLVSGLRLPSDTPLYSSDTSELV